MVGSKAFRQAILEVAALSLMQINIQEKIFSPNTKHAHLAILNLNLMLDEHQFICLVGPSGCGKTSLLNIIAGLDSDYKGHISLIDQSKFPKIGYVFQDPRLLPWRTVRQNIELVVDQTATQTSIDELLEIMELTGVQHKYPQHLSLGMNRRVAIIRAFAINPDLLLMDEPFVSLDAPTARNVRNLLLKLWHQRPHTVLFVTHDLREAITLADRLVFLSNAPMNIISEIDVDIPRSERHEENRIEKFRQHLLEQYTAINALL
jgi:ABC-type nitrate/sulfonate/bicarbonate transport system ATPase subunit